MANQLRRFDDVFLLMFGRIVSRTFIILAILAVIADSAWAFRPEEPQARLHTFGIQSIIAGPPPTDGHVGIASHLKGASNKAGRHGLSNPNRRLGKIQPPRLGLTPLSHSIIISEDANVAQR